MPAQHIQPFPKPSPPAKPKEVYLPCGTLVAAPSGQTDRKGPPPKVR